MNQTFRVGIVGAGYVAAHHLRALRDLPFVETVGITDLDEVRASQLAARFKVSGVYPSLSKMASAQPDVMHVLTPPASHRALAVEALSMGCHVLVEKPMAETVSECDEMIACARENGRVLSVNHSARFDPAVLQAAAAVRRGVCGDVIAVHFIRSSDYPPYAGGPLPPPYRQGSYPFRDLGVHGLYLLELFLGNLENLQVSFHETGRDPLLTFDEWRAHAECERGTGYMYLSWNTRPIQNELWIHGTKAVIHVDCFLQTCEISSTMPGPKQIGMVLTGTANAVRKSLRIPWNMVRFAAGRLKPSPGIYLGVHRFYESLQRGTPVPVTAEEGRRVTSWIASAAEGADREKVARLERQAMQPLEPARILVTGGRGFLGSALVERLRAQGEPIRLLLRRPPKPHSPADPAGTGGPVSLMYGSLGQPDVVDRAMEGVEVVYHLGAAKKGGMAEFEQGTVWGTRNVIESCIKHQVKRLIYVSSLSVLDHAGHRTGDPVTEYSRREPYPQRRGAYTQTKVAAEQMVLDAVAKRGLPAVILRPGQIFGPGAETTVPNGVISIAGRWIVAGDGKRNLPLVYCDDVVDALIAAAEREEAVGKILNLVDPTPLDQNQYLRHAREALEDIPVWKVPIFVLMTAALGIEILGALLKRSVPLSRYRIRSLKPLYPFDTSAADHCLGWTPRLGTSEGLKRTFGWKSV
jgi:predicted dehydrogenase/nucleoside-diphosphate-sugar epimerase